MRARLSVRTMVWCALLAVSACTFDRQVIAVPPSQVVVHGVLDPADTLVEVLIERSLTGAVTTPKERYDPLDPINTGGGVPARGAQVSITGPDGTTPGLEVVYPGRSPFGAGRYVFRRLIVRPGGKYALNIRTADGIVVTGTTLVPQWLDPAAGILTPGGTLRRDRDTLSLSWAPVPNARTYGLRIDSPFGALQLFSDSTRLHLAGGMRNIFANDLTRVFIPGFQQAYAVYAADTNFFDYYRSRNDPFTGSGIINRLAGGVGLFGSTVTISSHYVDVTQAIAEPAFEGDYEVVQAPFQARSLVDIMRLYIETPATATLGASLSGWYFRDRTTATRDGFIGTRNGASIELKFLHNQDALQHLATFVGRQSNDSLIGTYSGITGTVVFRKRVTP